MELPPNGGFSQPVLKKSFKYGEMQKTVNAFCCSYCSLFTIFAHALFEYNIFLGAVFATLSIVLIIELMNTLWKKLYIKRNRISNDERRLLMVLDDYRKELFPYFLFASFFAAMFILAEEEISITEEKKAEINKQIGEFIGLSDEAKSILLFVPNAINDLFVKGLNLQ
jgi:hypothetical protein